VPSLDCGRRRSEGQAGLDRFDAHAGVRKIVALQCQNLPNLQIVAKNVAKPSLSNANRKRIKI
jgi:hypothetical protein